MEKQTVARSGFSLVWRRRNQLLAEYVFVASTCDPEHVKRLNPIARSRYHFKLSGLPGPYNFEKMENNPNSWPDLTFGDLCTYLIEKPGIYLKECLKDFKSLETYLSVCHQ